MPVEPIIQFMECFANVLMQYLSNGYTKTLVSQTRQTVSVILFSRFYM